MWGSGTILLCSLWSQVSAFKSLVLWLSVYLCTALNIFRRWSPVLPPALASSQHLARVADLLLVTPLSPFYLFQKGQSPSKSSLHLPLVPLSRLSCLSGHLSVCLRDSGRKSLEPHPAECACPVYCSLSPGESQLQSSGVTRRVPCALSPRGLGMHVWKCIHGRQG